MIVREPNDNKNLPALDTALSRVSLTCGSLYPARNIVIFPLPGVGDTLNTYPALGVLRKAYPQANITVIVMFKSAFEVLENNPVIDEVIYWPFMQKGAWKSLKFMASINMRRVDVSIMAYPANRIEYNLISLLTGARLRIAHRYHHRTWRSLFFVNNRLVLEDNRLHNVEENMRLLSLLGIQAKKWDKPRIWLSEQDRTFARSWIAERKLEPKRLIAIHPGCATFKNQTKRRWAPEKYMELGRRLISGEGAQIIVLGGVREDALKTEVVKGIGRGAYPVCGATIIQSAALISQCSMMVSGDTGLMHVAGTAGIPIVTIFGPTDVNWVYPYRSTYRVVNKNLPCSPCFYYSTRHLSCDRFGDFRCITQITVEDVLKEVRDLLPTSPAR